MTHAGMSMKNPAISMRLVIVALGAFGVLTVSVLAFCGLLGIEHQLDARRDVVALEKILLNHNNADNFMDDVRADVLRAVQNAAGVNREGASTIRTDVQHHTEVVNSAIAENLAAAPSSFLRDEYIRITGLAAAFTPAGQRAVELALTDPVAGATNYEQFRLSFSALEESMDQLRDVLKEQLQQVRKNAAIAAARLEKTIAIYTALGGLLIALLTYVSSKIASKITSELASSKEEAQRMALHDPLTGLPNRTYLGESLSEALAQCGNKEGMIAVHCLDLDRFKQVNDTLGHPIGDSLLRAVAERLRRCIRSSDIVVRLGGDEFAIVQSPLARVEDAGILAQNIINAISMPYDLQSHHVTIGISVGVALAPIDTDNAGELIKMADIALYRAKTEGRGLFRVFERGMDTKLQARRSLELDLREAVEQSQFELYFQPIADIALGRVTALEALIRWKHPRRGIVCPDEFIPLAEETGLIAPLGAWVLKQACMDAAKWPDDLKVAVNVSAMQFKLGDLVADVVDALQASDLAPERLELEITETALLTDAAKNIITLHTLRSKGVRIAMDDFGTGYSSLGYLRSFPFDKIKIDRCFIQDVTTSADCKAIVRAVTGLGLSLGVTTTAEGVETLEQLKMISDEGCDQVQGYLFSRPVPAQDVLELLGRPLPSTSIRNTSSYAA